MPGRFFSRITAKDVVFLEKEIKKINPKSFIKILDIGETYASDPATANSRTYFTPYCMLRLYADQIAGMPDKILYLDTDIVCLNDPMEFY